MDPIVAEKEMNFLSCGEETSKGGLMELEEYMQRLIESPKNVANMMSSLMNLISHTPTNIRQNAVFNNVV